MMTSLFIRIIGGICGGVIGTFVTGQIYDYIYNGPHNSSSNQDKRNKNNSFQNAKSFEEIFNMVTIEKINEENDEYPCDRENKNINKEIKPPNSLEMEKERTFINDAIYDNHFMDFYSIYLNTFEKE